MPVDDFGNVADMIVAPETALNRMSMGQIYETFISLLGGFVLRKIKDVPYLEAYDYLLEFIGDLNIAFKGTIERTIGNNDNYKRDYVNYCLDSNMIVVVLPGFVKELNPKWCLKMIDKYGVYTTPLEYNLRDEDGNFIRRVRTKNCHLIGKKYIYCLCKIPHARASGVTYINQLGIPIKVKHSVARTPMALTPIRFGEDEVRNLTMVCGTDIAYRILSSHANSLDGVLKTVETELTEFHPSRINRMEMTKDELTATNKSIQVFKHLLHTIGVDGYDLEVSEEEVTNMRKQIYDGIEGAF